MKVRYNTVVGIIFVVLGAVSTVLGLWLTLLGDFNPSVFVGLLCLLLGILYLVRPYFYVHQSAVVVPAVVGPAKREFPFQSLTFDGSKMIAVRTDGTTKKVPVARWMANTGDWDAVMNARTTPGSR
jgi:hypothetical protein